MARGDARFTILEAFGAPQRRGFSLSLLAAEEWDTLARNTGVVRVDVDTAATQPTTHAIFPQWWYGAGDMRLADWSVRWQDGETEAIDLAKASMEEELAGLVEKDEPTADDQARIWELNDQIARLQTQAFWYEAPNAFGQGGTALYRACSAPNVPFKLASNWTLDPDRPFTIFLHRSKPDPAQKDCWIRFRFGCWALVLRQESEVKLYRYKHGRIWEDDNQNDNPEVGEWHTYDGWDWPAIEAAEATMDAIRDNGRLTAEDRASIETWKKLVRDTKAAAKAAKRDLTEDEHLQITAWQDAIAALRDEKKGLGQGEKEQLDALERDLYDDVADVQWQDAAESLFNRDVAFTIIPQPRGYMVIHCSVGRNYWVYEDKRVTADEVDQSIIGASRLQVDGNGGAFWFEAAYIVPEPCTYIRSQPVYLGANVDGLGAPNWLSSWAATEMPGTTARVFPTFGGDRMTWQLDLRTALGYLPFVYRVNLDVFSAERDRARETALFSSDGAPDVAWEVGRQYDRERRGRSATLTLTFDATRYPSLLRMAHKQVVFEEHGRPWFTGVLQDPSVEWLNASMVRVEYRAYDRWHILRTDKLWGEVVGDGKTLGAYWAEVLRGAGFAEDEVVVIACDATDQVLPTARAGELPAIRPQWGEERASYLSKLLDDFGYYLDTWFDGAGVCYLGPADTTTKDVVFTARSAYQGDPRAVRDLTREEDWTGFANDVSVMGATRNGKALGARYQDWDSVTDPQASNYVGRWIVAEPYQNDMLKHQHQVNAACYWRAYKARFPVVTWSFTTGHDETLEPGDRVTFDGPEGRQTVIVREVRSDNRSDGTMGVTVEVAR